ncbi:MAG: hypothetical protein ACJ72D_11895 [Marmoricola sp.]
MRMIRRTRSLAATGLFVVAAVMTAGCGSSSDKAPRADPTPSIAPVSPTTTAPPAACAEAPGAVVATAQVDLAGDGTKQSVEVHAARGACQPAVTVGGEPAAGSALLETEMKPVKGAARPVSVPGRKGQFVVVRVAHARGAHQDFLVGSVDGKLGVLRDDFGEVPFGVVTTDTSDPADLAEVRCASAGIEVRSAVEGSGTSNGGWDVYLTTFEVKGNTMTKVGSSQPQGTFTELQLTQQFPAMERGSFLENCTS